MGAAAMPACGRYLAERTARPIGILAQAAPFALRRRWLRRQTMLARAMVYLYLVCFAVSLLLDHMVPLAIAP
jgi:hypothetical protein